MAAHWQKPVTQRLFSKLDPGGERAAGSAATTRSPSVESNLSRASFSAPASLTLVTISGISVCRGTVPQDRAPVSFNLAVPNVCTIAARRQLLPLWEKDGFEKGRAPVSLSIRPPPGLSLPANASEALRAGAAASAAPEKELTGQELCDFVNPKMNDLTWNPVTGSSGVSSTISLMALLGSENDATGEKVDTTAVTSDSKSLGSLKQCYDPSCNCQESSDLDGTTCSQHPSIGSALHAENACRPCHYFYSSGGCALGTSCGFCHYKHSHSIIPCLPKTQRKLCQELLQTYFRAPRRSQERLAAEEQILQWASSDSRLGGYMRKRLSCSKGSDITTSEDDSDVRRLVQTARQALKGPVWNSGQVFSL